MVVGFLVLAQLGRCTVVDAADIHVNRAIRTFGKEKSINAKGNSGNNDHCDDQRQYFLHALHLISRLVNQDCGQGSETVVPPRCGFGTLEVKSMPTAST